MKDETQLPPLPTVDIEGRFVDGYSSEAMEAYARAAIAADRQAREEVIGPFNSADELIESLNARGDVERDAARYRWLRQNSGELARLADYATEESDEEVWANGMDDFIDAAIQQEGA